MIGQESKPIEEILGYIDDKEKIVLIGCGGCAATFHTGGEAEVKKMADTLTGYGWNVLAAIALPAGEFACYAPQIKGRLKQYLGQLEQADAVLMMGCGNGLQVVRKLLDDDFKLVKPIYPASNTIGIMGGGPISFEEECRHCGDCMLGQYAGICPLTHCAKGLLNGACGGQKGGKCEQDAERDCGWVQIYDRLKKLGELDRMKELVPPKDYSKTVSQRRIKLGAQ